MNALRLILRNASLCALAWMGLAASVAAPRQESGVIDVGQVDGTVWRAVTFTSPFPAPPVVIVGPPSYNDPAPTTVRVRHVTATGFEVQIDEWNYLDGVHAVEALGFLALEPGVHSIGGRVWEAGRLSGATHALKTVRLMGKFAAAPVILTQAETANNPRALAARVRNVTRTTFQMRLQAQRADHTAIAAESVAYVAVTAGVGLLTGTPYFAGRSGAMPTHTWKALNFSGSYPGGIFLGQTQAFDGGNPCALRVRNLTGTGVELLVEEEDSRMMERRRTTENVGFLVFGAAEAAAKLELGVVDWDPEVSGGWQRVDLAATYAKPVVSIGPPTFFDDQPATVRVRQAAKNSFEFRVENWDGAAHAAESISYLVMEEGVFTIGGLRWQAGRVAGVTQAPAARAFTEPFAATPVVFAQVATVSEASPVSARLSGITSAGFTVELDEAESSDGVHAGEEVHFVAIQKGAGRFQSNKLRFEAAVAANSFTDQFSLLPFSKLFAAPLFLGGMQTRHDADPAGVRQRFLDFEGVELKIDEETIGDAETTHGPESLGFLLVSTVVDSDEDGLHDAWEIAYGLDPNDPSDADDDGDNDGLNNLAEFRYGRSPSTPDSRGTITVAVVAPDAFELEGTPARLHIVRTGSDLPVTVPYTLGGQAAAGTDYRVKTSAGTVLNGSVEIPFNGVSVEVLIEPIADSVMEYPETATLTLTASPRYTLGATTSAAPVIFDATDLPENEQLFVAFLHAQDGAQTFASGLATLHLNGPKNRTRVNLSFSGLTSNQTNAYIRYGVLAGIGPELRPTLPIGQVTNETWNIAPVGAITGQNIIDGLFQIAGQFVYLNVGTGSYPAGEISGIWERETGSTEFVPPPDPPPLEPATGSALTREVARFLTQATFGPTQGEIDSLAASIATTHAGNRLAGFDAWIDQQLTLDQTRLLDYTNAADAEEWALRGGDPENPNNNEPNHHNRRRGWWLLATRAHDELRQRVAFALSEIFVISDVETEVRNRHYGAANYYDTLGGFVNGNYRDLLEAVSKSPMMGKYLSHLKNQKAIIDPDTQQVLISPDENYAREVMQLFSIGLVHRHPDGTLKLGPDGLPIATYGNDDITELARVFTGWSFSKRHGTQAQGYPIQDNTNFNQGNGPAYFQASWIYPMANFAAYHDTDAKTVVGTTIPAGHNGEADLDAALNILFQHPNTPPFISRLLIQRLVTSNPSAGYVHRVARKFIDNGSGVRGDLRAVVKAILLDYEARSLEVVTSVGYGKQKEPLVRYVQFIRALDGQSQIPLSRLSSYGYPAAQFNNFPAGTTLVRFPVTDARLGQTPQRSPTVFNWFLPDFNPGGAIASAGLVAPEMQLTTETGISNVINYHYALAQNDTGQSVDAMVNAANGNEDNVRLDRTPLVQMYDAEIGAGRSVPQALSKVLDYLDVLLLSGNLAATYGSAPAPNPRSIIIENVAAMSATSATRMKELLYLVVTSPEYIHQK